MREIKTEIVINAPANVVWSILTDFQRFPEWNPFIPKATGDVKEGTQLRVRIQPPDSSGMNFKPKVIRVRKEREFRWLGRLFIPGIFDGEHIFQIEPINETKTRFLQREKSTVSLYLSYGIA
jgi:uncharacterized membrane protein